MPARLGPGDRLGDRLCALRPQQDDRGEDAHQAEDRPDGELEVESVRERGRRRGARGDLRVRVVGRDRAQDRQPQGGADEAGGVEHARREPAEGARYAFDRHDRRGNQRQPEAESAEHATGEHVRQIGAARVDADQQGLPGGGGEHPGGEHGAGPEAARETRRKGGAGADREGHGYEREPGLESAVAESALHIEGLEEPEAEDRGVEQEDHEVGGPQVAEAEDAEGHQRDTLRVLGQPRLVEAEGHEQCRSRYDGPEHAEGAPAEPVGGDDPVGEGGHPEGDQHGPREVEVTVLDLAPSFGHEAAAEEHDREPDRDVDDEDRRPAERLGEDPAEQDPGGRADGADRAPGTQRAVARRALVKGGRDDRQGGGGEDRSADPLQRAGGDQGAGGGRDRAEQGGAREDQRAGVEHASAAEEIRGAPAEQQETREGEGVSVQDPLQAIGGEAQRILDRRQGDVHDRDIEDHHELAQTDHEQQRVRVAARDRPCRGDRVHLRTASRM